MQPQYDERPTTLTLQILDQTLKGALDHDVTVRLWDGTLWPDDRPARATLVLNHPGALRSMFLTGTEVGLAEAYLYNDFEIEGEIEAIFGAAELLQQLALSPVAKLRILNDLRQLPAYDRRQPLSRGPAALKGSRHSTARDQQAIAYHYDISNDFYRLWLDQAMVYSCAYFQTPADTLDQAQANKLEYICRKLRLKPGARLLDIGCGWGGLALYAARHYGAEVTGITLSQAQAEYAQAQVRAAGLDGRVQIRVQDYREVPGEGAYDALVSVGMFEHVGAALLPRYFEQAYRLVKPGGVFLNHGISRGGPETEQKQRRREPGFLERYVFPDGELVPVTTTLQVARQAGFEIRDVESLREHYALTLRHWVNRLEQHHDQALEFVAEPTYRVWRLYMAGSAHSFRRGHVNIYQTLLVKPDAGGASHLPLTRSDWYWAFPGVQ